MGSDHNVVNLSPIALIFQGYRALFFCKNFCFFSEKNLTKTSKSEVASRPINQGKCRCSDKLNHT